MTDRPSNLLSRADRLPLVGCAHAWDFTNTSSGRGHPSFQEHFLSATDIVAWARHARLLTPSDGDRLAEAVLAQSGLSAALLARAVALRDVIFRIGSAVAAGSRPRAVDIGLLADAHAACIARASLVSRGAVFVWAWDPQIAPVESILGPVVLSALTLLTRSDAGRIKQCEGDHCGWLFFDATKNKSRRWCEMEVCGNRAKQKRRRGRPPQASAV